MKKQVIFIVFFFAIAIFSFDASAQINVNTIKNNAQNIGKGKKDKKDKKDKGKNNDKDNKSGGNYVSLMNLGAEKSEEGDYYSSLVYYKQALEKKPGDYSAKQSVDQTEKDLRNQYFDKIELSIENGDCEQAQKELDTVMIVLERWGQQDYFQREINKCVENSNSPSSKVVPVDISKIPTESGKFYTDFSAKDFKNDVSVGDELFLVFNLGKTMIEHTVDLGMEEGFYAYGFFTFSIDGKKVKVIGPYAFSSEYSKVWTDFTVPLSVNNDFAQKLQENPELLATSQDIWLLQQLYGDNSIPMEYVMAAIGGMQTVGSHKLKVEFGLGEKDASEPVGNVCSAEITVKSDNESLKELYKKGPKYMRPLDDKDMGTFKFASNTLNAGSETITTTLELANPPKFYNQYWCQSMSCDYDHGELNFYAELDGNYLASWGTTFWNENYETKKSFNITILPQNDKDLTDDLCSFNSGIIFKNTSNPLPYAIFDAIYSGKMNVGTHTLKIKVYSPETKPMSETYENTKEWHNRWPAIAETTVNINLTSGAKQQIIASSSAKKLSHAGGKWTSVDSYLKNSSTNEGATIIDVATYTEWDVALDVFGQPIYRTCKAAILYKTKDGAYRIMRGIEVKEDYNGGSYSKPYFNETIYYGLRGGSLHPMHYPVPASKVK